MATTREKVLKIYGSKGPDAAAEAAGVSKRTAQRWAAAAGVKYHYENPILRGHRTSACYARGCRKKQCVEANKEAQRAIKARRVERRIRGEAKFKHGVSGYSNWDCRCGRCKKSWSEYLRERRSISIEEG